jgi:hypothetical protein
MHEQSNQTRDTTQRLVVIDLLGRPRGHRRPTIYRHLRGHDQAAINAAIASLVEDGVLTTSDDDRVTTTPALVRLEALGLIGV